MTPAAATELTESISQFIRAWNVLSQGIPGRDVDELDGLSAVWANVPLVVYNAVFVSTPVTSRTDLEGRAARASAYMKAKRHPGLLFVCEEWLPRSVDAAAIFAGTGLHPSMTLTGMAADALADPTHPLPALEYRRAADPSTRDSVSDINSLAYGFPIEWGRETVALPESWGEDIYGYVAYTGGTAVATSTTIALDGRLYVALVATLPDQQRRGYAEGVMRHSLTEAAAASGLRRTILHASEAGRPVYQRMGFHATSRFTAYTLGHE